MEDRRCSAGRRARAAEQQAHERERERGRETKRERERQRTTAARLFWRQRERTVEVHHSGERARGKPAAQAAVSYTRTHTASSAEEKAEPGGKKGGAETLTRATPSWPNAHTLPLCSARCSAGSWLELGGNLVGTWLDLGWGFRGGAGAPCPCPCRRCRSRVAVRRRGRRA